MPTFLTHPSLEFKQLIVLLGLRIIWSLQVSQDVSSITFAIQHIVLNCLLISEILRLTATDMPDYDDRKDLEGEDEDQATHYSKTMDRISIYGEGKVYVDRDIAHEKIVMKTQQVGSISLSTTK